MLSLGVQGSGFDLTMPAPLSTSAGNPRRSSNVVFRTTRPFKCKKPVVWYAAHARRLPHRWVVLSRQNGTEMLLRRVLASRHRSRVLFAVAGLSWIASTLTTRAQDATTRPTEVGYDGVVAERGRTADAVRFERLLSLYLGEDGAAVPTIRDIAGQKTIWVARGEPKAAADRRLALARLEAVRSINPEELSPGLRLDWQVLMNKASADASLAQFPTEYASPSWPEYDLDGRIRPLPRASVADYREILAWLRGVSLAVTESETLLQKAVARRVTVSAGEAALVLNYSRTLAPADPLASPYLAAFKQFPSTISAEDQKALLEDAVAVYRTAIRPAYATFLAYLESTYLPEARATTGMYTFPDGANWYAAHVRLLTGLAKSPEDIHQDGLREVSRLQSELAALARNAGFDGSFEAFLTRLRSDARCAPLDSNAITTAAAKVMAVVDEHLPRLFITIPKTPYDVTPAPKLQPGTFGQARPGGKGRRGQVLFETPFSNGCGFFNVLLHEAMPGHLLQMHLVSESNDISELRRRQFLPAFSEGWAHYASGLAGDLGIEQDAYARAERGTGELMVAVRAVIDTGIHWKGWTRDRALEYYRTTLPWSPAANAGREIDGVLLSPGGRLAYMVGQQKFGELRRFAEAQLGKAFVVREFHEEILRNGQLPLDVLDGHIRGWVASQTR